MATDDEVRAVWAEATVNAVWICILFHTQFSLGFSFRLDLALSPQMQCSHYLVVQSCPSDWLETCMSPLGNVMC